MTQFISSVNNNKFSAPRKEGSDISTVVITYSVTDNIQNTINTLYARGTSVHYTIREDGFQDQHHNEDAKAFYAGKSSWHGVEGVNDYGIGIMLINDAVSPFKDVQITKLVSLLGDINLRHGKVLEVVGLGEVAAYRGPGVAAHIAPGKLFPWDKLAAAGFGKHIDLANYNEVCVNLGEDETKNIQAKLITHGYNLAVTSAYDEAIIKVVNVFNSRYNQHQENSECWSEASDAALNYLVPPVSQPEELVTPVATQDEL